MSFESLSLENYGIGLMKSDEDSDEDPCYGEKCISTFRLLLDDIQSKNSSRNNNSACQSVAEEHVQDVEVNEQLSISVSDQIQSAQMVLGQTYCPPTAQSFGNKVKTMPTIPDSNANVQAAVQRAGGGASKSTTPAASPFIFTQAADQQFSSAANVDSTRLNSEQEPQIVVRHRNPPQLPPKPQIDLVRYSMANVKDDLDLDTILSELLELENQLSGDAADQLLVGITSPLSQPSASSSSNQIGAQTSGAANKINSNETGGASTLVRHGELPQKRNFPITSEHSNPPSKCTFVHATRANATEICASPDIDSAYGDSSSTESSGRNRNRNSEVSSYGGSLNTPSPTNQGSPKSSGSTNELEPNRPPLTDGEIKAQKIREALEKMKEAKMKKIYVKFFLEDGTTKGLLIDERWTVLDTMRHLAIKLGIVLTPEHSIVEEYPDMHIKRIYEDHEYVVENIEDWLADSKNKLYFIRRMDKFCFIHKPEYYLLTDKIEFEFSTSNAWTSHQRSDLIQRYLENETLVPELEGWLLLKSDGRKSWKKHYFVLRSSGLYYSKGKMRGAKDLQCLMNVYNNQVYSCTDWKKYKAPTNFGFAIKHPKIQAKNSKYIKYICTDDEASFRKWVTALRIVKNGFNCLEKNFRITLNEMQKAAASKPIHVDTQVHQRLPIFELNTNVSTHSFPTRPQSSANQSVNSVNGVNSSRVSVVSRQTQNESTNIAFDQDDCGTIKRHPCFGTDPLCNSLSTSTFNSNLYPQRSNTSTVFTSNSNTSSITAEVHNESLGAAKTINSANCDDLDSDEEHFPPPPEIKSNGSTTTPHSVYQNGFDVQRSSQTSFNSPSTQPVQFRNGFRPSKPPILTPKPSLTPQRMTNKPPNRAPPPPKRSENTRIQASSLMNEQHKQQMDLFNELQYKIQARQIDTT